MRKIDADALKKHYNVPDAEGVFSYCDTIMQVIDSQPTIKPEVRHGRMIEGRYPNENKCSECGQIFRDDIQFIYPYYEKCVCKTPKRCPECGCYWDGGAENV